MKLEDITDRILDPLSHKAEKKADAVSLRDGEYRDVKSVYDALSDHEKSLITPGRTSYKDVPVLARTVAYDGKSPVGFADWYSKKHGPSLCVAVSDRARGRGLAREMALDSIRKILNRIRANRVAAELAGGDALREYNNQRRLRHFMWTLVKGNESSARAATNAGFTERRVLWPFSRYRSFILPRDKAEELIDLDGEVGKTKSGRSEKSEKKNEKKVFNDDGTEKTAQVKQDSPMKAENDIVSDDMKHFSGVIAPWIKNNSVNRYGKAVGGDPISFKYYSPDFYKNIDFRTSDAKINHWFDGFTQAIGPWGDMRITMGPNIANTRPDLLAHEIRHAQNLAVIPGRYNRNKFEDDTLHAAYAFKPEAIMINYGRSSIPGIDIERLSREEEAATNAQYQWAAFQEIKKQLGRRPSPKEFVDGISGMSIDDLRKLRAYYGKNGANLYEPVSWNYDVANKWAVNNGYKSFNDYQDSLKAKAEKLFESGLDPDKVMRQIKDDPTTKSLNEATKNVSAPVWTDEQIEAFRNALMHVAKNKVRTGGPYQNV